MEVLKIEENKKDFLLKKEKNNEIKSQKIYLFPSYNENDSFTFNDKNYNQTKIQIEKREKENAKNNSSDSSVKNHFVKENKKKKK